MGCQFLNGTQRWQAACLPLLQKGQQLTQAADQNRRESEILFRMLGDYRAALLARTLRIAPQ